MQRVAVLLLALVLAAACSRHRSREETAVVPIRAPVAIGGGPSDESERSTRMRMDLIDRIERNGSVHDPRVLQAMRMVPRHLFVGERALESAYDDRALPIGHGQTISQPTVVGMMTEALSLKGNERVLEIGTGSGYQAAILSLLAREVYSIELVEPLAHEADDRLKQLGYRVNVRAGDGYKGWPEAAPFDRIILTAAPPEIPQTLIDQLAPGGILVAPEGEGIQELVRVRKVNGGLQRERLDIVVFVPMVPGE